MINTEGKTVEQVFIEIANALVSQGERCLKISEEGGIKWLRLNASHVRKLLSHSN